MFFTPERFPVSKQLKLLERLKRLEHASSRCVQREEGLNPQVKGNFFPTIPDDFTGFEDPKVASGSYEAKYLSRVSSASLTRRSALAYKVLQFCRLCYNRHVKRSAGERDSS